MFSPSRWQMCEKVAAGVACVMRVVVTAPVPMPAAFAISSRVVTGLPLPLCGQVESVPFR